MSEPLRALKFIAPVVALALIPLIVAGGLIIASANAEDTALSPPASATVPVGITLNEARQQVEISVATAVAPETQVATQGVVTALSIEAGTPIVPGMLLGSVNDVPVAAYVSGVPLYRDLGLGDRGQDVRSFQEFLIAAGYDLGQADGIFGPGTRDSLKALEKALALPTDGVVQRANFAWVPAGVETVGSLAVGLGQKVEVGSALFTAVSRVETLRIYLPDSPDRAIELPDTAAPELVVGEASFALSSLAPTDTAADDLYAFLQAQAAAGKLTAEILDGSTIFHGAVVADASAAEIASVPGSALYVTKGHSCVFVTDGDGYRAVPIENPQLIAGSLDAVQVPIALKGSSVALDPMTLSDKARTSCSSK